jgi:serine/threonine protein kinase
VHQVGAGVLGPVYRGYDPEQDRAVAIKAFPLDLTPERARELAAELGRLPTVGLEHPAAVAPLAAGAEGSTVYLVQEYFVAESADVALKQYGPAPVPDAVRLIGQLAGALDTAAGAGVFHGALHPRDILVAPHEVRLTGLGVAAALERAGVRVPVRRPYAAPERVAGGPVSAAADVFSLACVAFELVTGRRPAQSGDEVTADTAAIDASDAVALAEAFARALSPRPEDRHPSALAFAAALKHALTGEPLVTAAETERPRQRRAGIGGQTAEPPFEFEPAAPSADEPHSVLPAELRLAEPLGSAAPYDPSVALLRHEAEVGDTAVGPFLELPSPPAPGSTPLPSFLASYSLVETQPAPLEPVSLDSALPEQATVHEAATRSPTPEPRASADEFAIDTVTQAPTPELLPLGLESLDLTGHNAEPAAAPAAENAASEPARDEAPAPTAPTPRRGLVPLFAMLLAGVLLGFPLGYLVAPRSRTAPPAAVKPAPPAPLPPAAVPSPAPAAPVPAPSTAAPSPAAPVPATAAPAPAAKKPPANVAASTRKKPPPRSKTATAVVGSLSIASRPEGATVTLDGRAVGVTPLTLPEVAAGSHAIRLELQGYRAWSVSAQVMAGQQKKVSASLERRERRPGG